MAPAPQARQLAQGTAGQALSEQSELSGWLKLFWPTVLTMLVRIGMGITDTAFVGHLQHDSSFPTATSVDFLSATSLALTWQGITSIICFNGGPPALSTLAGQAFGARNLPLMGTWLHLSLLYSLVAAVPVAVSWWFTSDVLRVALSRRACSETCLGLAEAFSQRSLISHSKWVILGRQLLRLPHTGSMRWRLCCTSQHGARNLGRWVCCGLMSARSSARHHKVLWRASHTVLDTQLIHQHVENCIRFRKDSQRRTIIVQRLLQVHYY